MEWRFLHVCSLLPSGLEPWWDAAQALPRSLLPAGDLLHQGFENHWM